MNNYIDKLTYSERISNQTKEWFADYCLYKKNKLQYDNTVLDVFGINECDFINNKKITFNILAGISCTFKCCEANPELCHNYHLINETPIKRNIHKVIELYKSQQLSQNITFQGGLEVLDNIKQLLWFIYFFRLDCKDDIFIWTGYTKRECDTFIKLVHMMEWENIYIKFGRFIPNNTPHFDNVIGVNLISYNQYAERIS